MVVLLENMTLNKNNYSFFTVLCGYLRVELSLLSTVGEAMRVQGSKKKKPYWQYLLWG